MLAKLRHYLHARRLTAGVGEQRANFTMKLVRPGFGPPAAAVQVRRRHDGCRSRIASSGVLAATAAPLRLRHAGPGRTAYREIR